MRRLAIVIVAIIVMSDAAALLGQRQGGAGPQVRQGGARRDRAPAVGTAVIRGRVVAAGTGAPVRRAEVQASTAGDRARAALTDAEGVFELRNLPAGTWTLRVAKTGFVSQQFGQRTPFSPSEQITVVDGQQATADFTLLHGGVIAGRVFDEFGDPVAGTRVSALRLVASATGPRLTPTGANVVSDDTGAYRLYGLAPGSYYIAAAPMTIPLVAGLATSEGPITYASTYFPGSADLSAAQRVVVAAGQEQHNISFGLSPLPSARISGVVIGATGAPIDGMVTLQGPVITETLAGSGRTRTSASGTFTFANVPPGSYILEVTGQARSRDEVPEVAAVPITVAGADITGLTVTATRGATMSGTVVADDGTAVATAGIRVGTQRLRVGPGGWSPRTQVTAAGAFELEGLVGPHHLRFEQLPTGWVVKSVSANGVEVADVPIDFRGTEQVTVRVVLTRRIALLTGSVRSARLPLRGSSVMVFPDDDSKWTPTSRYVKTARIGDDGAFSIRALPPHTHYLAIALEYLESGEQFDAEFLRRMKPQATAFALAEGQSATIALELVTR